MVNEPKKIVWAGLLALGLGALAAAPAGAQEAEAPRKVTKRVTPVYPLLAQQGRLTGTVKLNLVVSPDGSVKSLRTVGGNPVLVTAAESAVKQWKYEPSKKETSETVAVKFDGPQ